MAASDTNLSAFPPSDQVVIEALWGRPQTFERMVNQERTPALRPDAYFDYYRQQRKGYSQQRSIRVQSISEINALVLRLRNGETLEGLLGMTTGTGNQQSGPEEGDGNAASGCEKSVEFAARLLVMVRIGKLENETLVRAPISWTTGSLRDFVKAQFPAKTASYPDTVGLHVARHRIPGALDAWALERVGGIKVQFTDNLADHLRLVEDDTKVLVFHHVFFLEMQRLAGSSSLLPEGLARETLLTLALLFPEAEYTPYGRFNKAKDKWLRDLKEQHKARRRCRVDERLAQCGIALEEDRLISHFVYWQERLAILRQVYDETTPSTFTQWWHDRRNGGQWYPFWIALMVFAVATLLGVVQSVLAAVQLYKAYYPSTGADL